MVNLASITQYYFPQSTLDILNKPIFGINPILDWWLVVHFTAGVILGSLSRRFRLTTMKAVILLSLFELFEQVLFNQGLAIPETFINTVLDIVIGTWGFILVREND